MSALIKPASTDPVVMVDDNEMDILIAVRCLKRSKLKNRLIGLRSGETFLEHLDRVERGGERMPALVLLDINMPGMDGFETLRRVRARAAFRALPIVMMLTSSDSPGDAERSRDLEATGFQTKPLRLEEYVTFFNRLLEEDAAALLG
jgi:chemotaxis family two-component system response regulator Rcp1